MYLINFYKDGKKIVLMDSEIDVKHTLSKYDIVEKDLGDVNITGEAVKYLPDHFPSAKLSEQYFATIG